MNILVSTTRDYNLGDKIIWLGVKRLLDNVFAEDCNYFFYNRNPDLFHGQYLHGNYLNYCPEWIDLVVLAGTPEFYETNMNALYTTLGEKTVWAIGLAWGVDSEDETIRPTPLDNEIMMRENFRIITRQKIAQKIIPKEVVSLPCPSLLVPMDYNGITIERLYVGDVEFASPMDFDVIVCYTVWEFEKAIKKFKNVKYVTEVDELFLYLGSSLNVYTSRLHVALPCLANKIPTFMCKTHGIRIKESIKEWDEYFRKGGTPESLFDDYKNILQEWKTKL